MKKYIFTPENSDLVYDFTPESERDKNYAEHCKLKWRDYVLDKLQQEVDAERFDTKK